MGRMVFFQGPDGRAAGRARCEVTAIGPAERAWVSPPCWAAPDNPWPRRPLRWEERSRKGRGPASHRCRNRKSGNLALSHQRNRCRENVGNFVRTCRRVFSPTPRRCYAATSHEQYSARAGVLCLKNVSIRYRTRFGLFGIFSEHSEHSLGCSSCFEWNVARWLRAERRFHEMTMAEAARQTP